MMHKNTELERQIIYLLTQGFACVFGGIFLLTLQQTTIPDWVLQIFGYFMFAVAFFLVVSPFNNMLMKWAYKINEYISGMLFGLTFGLLIKSYFDIKTQGLQLLSILVITWGVILFVEVMWDKRIH
jgi:hypothetical protein